ncbi:hypothetical protein TNCV_1515541 [Trichonephila clavipes]|nr:hypothetical protein TNCV_1515541 [Trichonephila clavipes]
MEKALYKFIDESNPEHAHSMQTILPTELQNRWMKLKLNCLKAKHEPSFSRIDWPFGVITLRVEHPKEFYYYTPNLDPKCISVVVPLPFPKA